jgi:hypothetical protein
MTARLGPRAARSLPSNRLAYEARMGADVDMIQIGL